MKTTLAAAMLGLMASDPDVAPTFVRLSVEQLVANPAAWDGKSVEVEGIASNRVENLGLYLNAADYCSRATTRQAIYVRWREVRGFRDSDEGHRLTIRGVFRNENGTERPTADGKIQVTFSTGAPGPGPLDRATVVRRVRSPRVTCQS